MAKKRSSSKAWLKEHRDDPYVQQAQREGYRSRACYKLLELQEKDRLIRPGMTVVDLGSAPGGWSQVAAELVGHHGRGKQQKQESVGHPIQQSVHHKSSNWTNTADIGPDGGGADK